MGKRSVWRFFHHAVRTVLAALFMFAAFGGLRAPWCGQAVCAGCASL
jgi:hypothetical protein